MKKLKIASLHINSVAEDSISTGVRLARYMSKFFDCPFIHNQRTAKAFLDKYDILFVKFGILKFCDYRDELFLLYRDAKRIIALEEDYTMGPDYRLTKVNPSLELWTNMPWRVDECTHGKGEYINWNRMTFRYNPKRHTQKFAAPVLKGLGYYGAYRPDREVYFEKYFANAPYPVYVSSFPRNHLKWRDLDSDIQIFSPFKDRSQIKCFQAVLYIEDVYTHTAYNSLANRFYECVSAGVPLLIDENCVNTFESAGHKRKNIEKYIVRNQSDVKKALEHTEEIRKLQRRFWYSDYNQELYRDVKRAVSKQIGEQYAIQSNYPNL